MFKLNELILEMLVKAISMIISSTHEAGGYAV